MNLKKINLLFAFVVSLLISIEANEYKRVISLAPSITKSIYYLQAQDLLVGCTDYCTIAIEDNKNVVASPVTINIEKVLSLNPDLILATSITKPEYVETLRKFKIRVEVFPSPESFNEICNQYIEMAKLLGRTGLATNMVSGINMKIDSLKLLNSANKNYRIFFQIGAKPLYTVIPSTFMNDYISFLNGENIAKDLTKGTISRESVINRKPDFIFIVTMGIIGEEEKLLWEEFSDIPAVKNRDIYIIDSDIACIPTPQTFLQTIEIIHNCLNK